MEKDLKITGLICIATVIVFLMGFIYDYQKDVRMAELGYQKTAVLGSTGTFYQKVPNGKEPERKVYDRADFNDVK